MNAHLAAHAIETARLAALDSFDILDTPREDDFDDIAKLASDICGTPIAVVNLIGGGRQFFKAEVGLGVRETPLDTSFCAKAILEDDFLIVPDATKDPRFDCNPLVTGEPGLRFYAGALLKTKEGHAIGTVCVLDMVARDLSDVQQNTLRVLAKQVMKQLELRKALADHSRSEYRRNALLDLGDALREASSREQVIAAASQIAGETLAVARAGVGQADAPFEHVNVQDWTAKGARSIAGVHRFEDYGRLRQDLVEGKPLIIENVNDDPRTSADPSRLIAIGAFSLVNVTIKENGEDTAIFFIHDDAPRIWLSEEVTFVRNVADRLSAAIARLKAEADQRILNEELSHRMKNTMAMIQAIATQTLKMVPDQAPVEAFNKRLHALSSAHDVLLKRNWSAARVSEIVKSVLGTFGMADRFHYSGPDVRFGARATLSLSLLLHELATNAIKYGSLSVEGGLVQIGWRIDQVNEAETLLFDWVELGGPVPMEPQDKTGFGSRLIRMGLIGTGKVNLRYERSGFEAIFEAPMNQVIQ